MKYPHPPCVSKVQLEPVYLIGNDKTPYDIYTRSAMKTERLRRVLALLQKRLRFRSANDVTSVHKTHADEIYLRLEQLGS